MSTLTPEHPASVRTQHGHPAPPAHRTTGGRFAAVAVAISAGLLVATLGYVLAASHGQEPALGPGVVTVEVRIQHSRFDLVDLRVHEGTVVQFVVRNADPIDHELVIGDGEVHRRHAAGSERVHPPTPGELSVGPGDTAMTFYGFDVPGTVVYTCHLPGHEAYGMTGTIEVLPAS
ncbi:MAG: plastocyanin/azurin family copper-binding protein [Microthrixaceae bacterium]